MNSDQGTGGGNAGRLTTGTLGASGGVEEVTLTGAQSGLKAHEHTVPATNTNSISDATTGDESQSHTHTRGGASNVAGSDPWTTIVASSGTVHTAHRAWRPLFSLTRLSHNHFLAKQ